MIQLWTCQGFQESLKWNILSPGYNSYILFKVDNVEVDMKDYEEIEIQSLFYHGTYIRW